MKKYILLFSILFVAIAAFPQSRKVLAERLNTVSAKIDALSSDIKYLIEQNKVLSMQMESLKTQLTVSKNENSYTKLNQASTHTTVVIQDSLNPGNTTSAVRCKAITASGSQCSRNAQPGSQYCWQHSKTYDPANSAKSPNQSSSTHGEIQTGPRGGQYYINGNGKKTYIRKK